MQDKPDIEALKAELDDKKAMLDAQLPTPRF